MEAVREVTGDLHRLVYGNQNDMEAPQDSGNPEEPSDEMVAFN